MAPGNKRLFHLGGVLVLGLTTAAWAGQARISIGDARVAEGNTGNSNMLFTVTRTAEPNSYLVIPYRSDPSTRNPATAGIDYTAPAPDSVLRIPAGVASGTIKVAVQGDHSLEPNETFLLHLGQPTAYALSADYMLSSGLAAKGKPGTVTVGDFNGDGNADLAITNVFGGTASVLLGDGGDGFTAAASFAAGTGAVAITVGDFDGNGSSDLAVVNLNSNTVSVLFNAPAQTAVLIDNEAVGTIVDDDDGAGRDDKR